MNSIIIAGGNGFLGNALTTHFLSRNQPVILLNRTSTSLRHPLLTEVIWDGKTLDTTWCAVLENAKALINLCGKSVDCRYTENNKKLILESRLGTTALLSQAIAQCKQPPAVWLNSSSATIYNGSYTAFQTEASTDIGNDFSMTVCKEWEAVVNNSKAPIRKILFRSAIVLGYSGGALRPLQNLVRAGLGGRQGNGKQYFSWMHERDFCRAIDFLISQDHLHGVINLCSPNPITNDTFMSTLRAVMQARIGLPLSKPVLQLGAFLIRTETELILKSRKVYPQRLADNKFVFEFPDLKSALVDLCQHGKKIK